MIRLATLALAVSASAAPVIEYSTTSDWGSGFNGQITIRNQGGENIPGWTLEFEFDRDITSIWDARIASRTGNKYVIRSAGWNDTIEAGRSLAFGFGGAPGGVTEGPRNMRLTAPGSVTPPAESTSASLALRLTSRWTDGFSATLTLTNTGPQTLKDWTLTLGIDATLTGFWNGAYRREGSSYIITPAGESSSVPVGGSAVMGFTASGEWRESGVTCQLAGGACSATVQAGTVNPAPGPGSPILMEGESASGPVTTLLPLAQGVTTVKLRKASGEAGIFRVISSNPAVVTAAVEDQSVRLTALAPGRASLRVDDSVSGASRWIGLRVNGSDGSPPGLPPYLSIGSVSEDSAAHLNFWRAIEPGARNKRVDARYIYLNGGPLYGWDTWSNEPGGRAIHYIRNSRSLGMVPFFVFYNIPDGGESYETDLAHVQSASYMAGYFRNLKLFLDIVRQESPDDMVGIILEPDFLGYLAQNAGRSAAEIPAATQAAYDTGVLGGSDPAFPSNVQGLVRAINYIITRDSPRAWFGWQMNLWASPAGGYTMPIPGKGVIRATDFTGYELGRDAIAREAAAITQYYLDAGITSYGANFVSLDKYGLDAAGIEPQAAADPAASTWFWNSDHWNNYLTFVQAVRETAGLPIVLWQLPVGRINASRESNPYSAGGRFPDLPNTIQRYEDSAPSFFFGDTFGATGARLDHFSANRAADPGLSFLSDEVTWSEHMTAAARAGVVCILFGPGVGVSTSNVGLPPSDDFWWITKAQRYLSLPVPLPGK